MSGRVCDVLVVGAGPAGSLAALVLARAGLSVQMLDRSRFPREKLCGDTLNPGSLAILERHALAAPVRARAVPIAGMTVTGPWRAAVSADYPRGLHGAAITRRDLDELLVQEAVAAGVRFDAGVTVLEPVMSPDATRVTGVRTVHRGGRDARHARIVIAADGRGSRLGSAVGLTRFARVPRRWAFGAYFGGVAGLTRRGEMHVRADGYIGVAPLPGGVANVCVVRATGFGGASFDRCAVLDGALASDPPLRERFRQAARISDVTVLGPLAVDARTSGTPGLLLAGDAAGFVDPMTGDGLRFALRGAELAAGAALDELATGVPAFNRLGALRAREFAAKWRVNRALRSLVGSPRALGLAARLAQYWPAPVEYLIGIAGDIDTASATLEPRIPDPESPIPDP